MKILLVLPDANIHKLKMGPLNISFREAPLTATLLAAMVPDELNADITVVDESVSSIPFDQAYDVVGISVLTGTSTRAYQIADIFRGKGSTIIMGGIHATLRPHEAKKHADAIITGFAELTWPRALLDYSKNNLKMYYHENGRNLERLPFARRDLQKTMGYMAPNTVFATRGCRSSCDFCSIPAAGYGWDTRPIHEVIDEIKQIGGKRVVFNDVHLTEDVEYAKELFTALIPLKKKWGGLASTRIVEDEELLDLMKKSGCIYLLLGFESINSRTLNHIHKRFNQVKEYLNLINQLHRRNIIIQGCFVFGFDEDDSYVFSNTVDFVNESKIDIPRYAIYTPYPDTSAFKRLKSEQRILHENWEYYDTQHVVFKPAQMTPEKLDDGFKWAVKKTYSLRSNLSRTFSSGSNFPVTFLGNLAYKLYVKRLFTEKTRFPLNMTLKMTCNQK